MEKNVGAKDKTIRVIAGVIFLGLGMRREDGIRKGNHAVKITIPRRPSMPSSAVAPVL
jgi:hypothetical protein